jgi:hypothetical protein
LSWKGKEFFLFVADHTGSTPDLVVSTVFLSLLSEGSVIRSRTMIQDLRGEDHLSFARFVSLYSFQVVTDGTHYSSAGSFLHLPPHVCPGKTAGGEMSEIGLSLES